LWRRLRRRRAGAEPHSNVTLDPTDSRDPRPLRPRHPPGRGGGAGL